MDSLNRMSVVEPMARFSLFTALGLASLIALAGPACAQQADDDALTTGSLPQASVLTALSAEAKAVRAVNDLLDESKMPAAKAQAQGIGDPAARAASLFLVLRRSGDNANLADHLAFLNAYPSVPGAGLIRRRTESLFLDQDAEAPLVRHYFATREPLTAKGKLALALALDPTHFEHARRLASEAYREGNLSVDAERGLISAFGKALTPEGHMIRMGRAVFSEDDAAALRAAARIGPGYLALAKAAIASHAKEGRATGLLALVPPALQNEALALLVKAQLARRAEKPSEAARHLLAITNASRLGSPREWSIERRMIVRALLDKGQAAEAFKLAVNRAPQGVGETPEAEVHAAWIALRVANEPSKALTPAETAVRLAKSPEQKARAHYWLGRVREALGRADARLSYEQAAGHTTNYYGQLARAKLGLSDLPMRTATPSGAGSSHKILSLLYAAEEPAQARAALLDVAQASRDAATLASLAALAQRAGDAKGTLLVGKLALQQGLALDSYAFPLNGVPSFRTSEGSAERAIVMAVARQESTFDPQAQSGAGARGLLQLMPATAAITARKAGLPFSLPRLTSDGAYNASLGAAHLGELMADFDGNLVLTFAAYNAGKSRVTAWIETYGDPRNPGVDPIDWVERIPFSETRHYVQHVLENLQVYRARLGDKRLAIMSDMRGSRVAAR